MVLRVWMALSDWPSVCGWKEEDMASLVPNRSCSRRQKVLVNFVSLSETIVRGRPCRRKMLVKKQLATSTAVSVVRLGAKCTCFETLSTKTVIASYFLAV